MRTFLIALGLATILLGLFLLFAGYVGVGCSVGGTTVSNCGADAELEIGGALLTVVAILMFAGALVPERQVGTQ
jgi:hypothetical protein